MIVLAIYSENHKRVSYEILMNLPNPQYQGLCKAVLFPSCIREGWIWGTVVTQIRGGFLRQAQENLLRQTQGPTFTGPGRFSISSDFSESAGMNFSYSYHIG